MTTQFVESPVFCDSDDGRKVDVGVKGPPYDALSASTVTITITSRLVS